jgi:asparagine synthase (glutamine-hydrolyzing)
MCGFVGFTGHYENKAELIGRMSERIAHRGPDMAGEYCDGGIALGFRRLSILDLSEGGRQPMTSPDGNYIIVYNGEIYNFMELRRGLEARGQRFTSHCDTEVLLRGYEEYGEKIVDMLRGMYSFAIWDKREQTLFGARDIFGIKPFYYDKLQNGELVFGSEIKSFLEHPDFVKELNPAALRPYLTFQYSATEETFFKGVYKLPPAHCFTYKKGELRFRRYYDFNFSEERIPFDECVDRLDAAIRESVTAHQISDVKVGAFLSGGVDSSYITAAMMPDTTFSVGFDYNKFNETNYAAELSEKLGIKNVRRMLSAEECFGALPTIQYHMDEPQSNPSSVPLYFLAQLAAEQVTVVLSGEGSDEIFAGYEWYDETPAMKKYKKLPGFVRRAAAAAASGMPYFKGHDFLIKCSGRPEDYFIGQALVYPEHEASALLRPEYRAGPTPHALTAPIYSRVSGKTELEKKQYLDLSLWLPGDILLKADKMSMAHSLELRVPFLDKNVMEMARKIPSDYKINGVNTKYVLRQAANRTIPDDWANREKIGFPVPIKYWLCEDKYYNFTREYFNSPSAKEFFDTSTLNGLLERHRSGAENNGRKIWTALTFLVWYKRFFDDEKSAIQIRKK